MARNILELQTLIDRATITVDGHPYDLINPEELSIVDTHRVGQWGARVQELRGNIEDRSEEEIQEMATLLDRLCRLLFKAPAEIHDRLTDVQRLSVATAFIMLQRGTLPVPAGANEAPAQADQPRDEPETSTGATS